jgi:hypothetical protein
MSVSGSLDDFVPNRSSSESLAMEILFGNAGEKLL